MVNFQSELILANGGRESQGKFNHGQYRQKMTPVPMSASTRQQYGPAFT